MNLVIISILIIAILGIVGYFNVDSFKKWYGNYNINKANDFLLESEDYYLMKNVVLLTFDGLQKFDYIIVSRFGIFVVMTQHYSGVILGTEYGPVWTQVTRGQQPLEFSNPTSVINERCRTLSTLLKLSKTEVYPVALFTGITGFKTPMSPKITYGSEYLKYIRSKNKVLFDSTETDKFVDIIEAKRKRQGLVNKSDQAEQYTQQSQQSVSALLQDNVCPDCGSELEVKTSESGANSGRQILVCKLFPTCRHSRSL